MGTWNGLYEQLATARYPALLAYATLLTGDRTAGEDLLHDAFVRVFGRPRRFADANHAEAYMRTTLAHLAMDRARGRRRMRAAVERVATPAVAEDAADAVGDRNTVASALATLPARERACVVLRYFDDLPVAEVAARLGIAEGTVKRYLAEARATLGGLLDMTEPAETLTITSPSRRNS